MTRVIVQLDLQDCGDGHVVIIQGDGDDAGTIALCPEEVRITRDWLSGIIERYQTEK